MCGATRGLYVLENYHDFEPFVFCDNCKLSVYNERANTEEDIVRVWNSIKRQILNYVEEKIKEVKYV